MGDAKNPVMVSIEKNIAIQASTEYCRLRKRKPSYHAYFYFRELTSADWHPKSPKASFKFRCVIV